MSRIGISSVRKSNPVESKSALISHIASPFTFTLSILLTLLLSLPAEAATFSAKDRDLLLKIEKDSARYFFEHTNASTGLTKDSSRPGAPSSIAATGFALSVFALSQQRGWISRAQAYSKVKKTLDFALNKMEHKRGFFYHFVDPRNGKRAWGSEISSIDTALFIAGALLASKVFSGDELSEMANKLYDRIDWNWMTNRTNFLSHGWNPERGFLPYYWDSYNEQLLLQALAHGSKTHAPPRHIWNEWERQEGQYKEYRVIYSYTGSLFTYQYPHAYIDFRNLMDGKINYYKNSTVATITNKAFCLDQQTKYKTYGPNSWGLTACLGPTGYRAYGAPPGLGLHDGTIAPYGAIASLPFTPQASLDALKFYYEQFGQNLYGQYGFKDAFNLNEEWFADEWLGIDQGITILMIENALNQTVWKYFMGLDCVKRWIDRCEL